MTPNEYQTAAMRTMCDQSKALLRMADVGPMQINNALIGLAGEVGELCEVWKKLIYHGKQMTPDELKACVLKEAGDVLWYVAALLGPLGLTMEQVMEANIAKLRARYPEKFTEERAENRDTAAEDKAAKNTMEI